MTTTQEMMDWVWTKELGPSEKMALLVLAWKAEPSWGGRLTMADFKRLSSAPGFTCEGLLHGLAERRLIVFKIEGDEFSYGLCGPENEAGAQ